MHVCACMCACRFMSNLTYGAVVTIGWASHVAATGVHALDSAAAHIHDNDQDAFVSTNEILLSFLSAAHADAVCCR
jgi:hypothetical protein